MVCLIQIYKYELPAFYQALVTPLDLPQGFKILKLAYQYGQPCLWVLHDLEAPKVKIRIYVIGTGQSIPTYINDLTFIETVGDGEFIWHVFYGE